MRHLYVRIYLTLLLVVVVCIVLAGFLARQLFDAGPHNRATMAPLVQLDDGRCVDVAVLQPPKQTGKHIGFLVMIFAVMALGCYPVARQITRRLESLKDGVEDWGAGDLSTRVEIAGRDEVANLAGSFNRAASRIEGLVEQQKRVLVHASHELRSPLTRLRMAIELIGDEDGDPKHRDLVDGAVGDIEELDDLIGEILLAARLESAEQPIASKMVDVLVLLEEEAERVGAKVLGEPSTLEVDAGLIRRMLRNLLENASRYSDDVEARLESRDAGVRDVGIRIVIADRGPGILENERERIFEPFYRPAGHSEGADGGVGLGLALVRWIAERHGGAVRYESREGGGSEFVVEL